VDGPGTQAELASLMGKAPGVIVAAIDQAEAKGLVERKRDPADRRRSRVTPTRKGLNALAKADKLADELVRQALGGLDRPGLDALGGLLRQGLGLDAPTPEA
jgi:DNA-binding MarR family transcriptional regulator